MTHHPTWTEIRAQYFSDPDVAAAAEQLHQLLCEDHYAPVVRDRAAERTRCEAGISGYARAREAGA